MLQKTSLSRQVFHLLQLDTIVWTTFAPVSSILRFKHGFVRTRGGICLLISLEKPLSSVDTKLLSE